MATDPAMSAESAVTAMHLLRFPPFPDAPDGIEIIPFHLFHPSGIRVPIDEDDEDYRLGPAAEIERDGLGIPTVALRVKHSLDNADKKKKRKKKVNGAQQVQVAPEKPKTWWEVWEELEDHRRNPYDASVHTSLITLCPPPCLEPM
jgi:hypothetical protein